MSSTASPAPDQKALPSSGTLLASSLQFYRRRLGTVLGYAGWLLVPLIATVAIRITLGMSETGIVLTRVVDGIGVALSVWVYIAIVQTVASDQKNAHAAPAPLGVQVLTVFFVLLAYYTLVLLGTSLFVIPGIIFGVWLCYAPVVSILERAGFFGAFLHSRELVKGMFWKTFSRLFAAGFIVAVIYLVIAGVLAIIYPGTFTTDLESGFPLPVDVVLSLAEIVLTPFGIIYVTQLYLARKTG